MYVSTRIQDRTWKPNSGIPFILYAVERAWMTGFFSKKNILISDDERAMIADFGISAMTTEFRGTLNWMVPQL